MPRIALYIDGGRFTDGIRGQGMSMDMDFVGFFRYLAGQAEIVATHFFVPEYPEFPYPKKHQNEKHRLAGIAAQGIEIHLSKPQLIGSVFVDRGIESLMTAKLILDAQSDRFDTALVISRRAELETAIAAVKTFGKSVEVAYFDYKMEPVNVLAAGADGEKRISIEEILAFRKAGPKPPFA